MTITRLTLVPVDDRASHETAGVSHVKPSTAELADACALYADGLAARAEAAGRLVAAQRDALAAGDVVEAARLCWGLDGALRALSGSLGKLHGDLDVLAHHSGPCAS